MWLCMKSHGAWLYGVHRTRRDGSSFMWLQPCKYITSVDSKAIHSCGITYEGSESARERRTALYKNDQHTQPVWPSGKLVSRRPAVRFRFSSPLSSKVVVCGHCLVTLSLIINETLKWLSSLPTLMQESLWWCKCSDRYIISLSIPLTPSPRP